MVTFKNSYWISSGLYSLLTKGINLITGFVSFYLLIRLLSVEDYGAWILFTSVGTMMELIKHGFIRNPLIRYLSITERKDWGSLQTASLILNSGIGVIQVILTIGMAYILSGFWNLPQLENLFLIYALSTIVLIPATHFEIIQQAGFQFKEFFFSSAVRHGCLLSYILLSLSFGWGISLEALAAVQCAAIIFSCLLSYAQSHTLLTLGKRLHKKWLLELFHYGKFTFGTNVSSMIVKNIDTWMLGKMISSEAVTIFNPAVRVSNLVEVPTDTLSSIYFPHVSKNIDMKNSNGKKGVKYFYEKAVATIMAIMLPVVIVVYFTADYVIQFIAGPGFEETVPILQTTMLFGLLIPFNRFLGITLDAIGKAKQNFLLVLVTAVMNVISNVLFIHSYGTIGAAYGTLCTYTVMVFCNQIYLYKKFGVTIISIVTLIGKIYRDFFFQFGNSLQSGDIKS